MKKLIVANWKMNPQSLKKAIFLFEFLSKNTKKIKNLEIVICPPFLFIPEISKKISHLKLGAQDCFFEEKGAFTGEISPRMLKNFKVEYVILGHSERRKYFKETNQMIKKKIEAAIKAKLKPILCIGENLKERKSKKTFEVLKNQLKGMPKTILAYEPVWAIGTKNPCPPKKAKEILIFLRKFSEKILYGGSLNSKNAKEYLKEGFDGLLVGGASLKPKEFLNLLKNCAFC